MAGCKVCRVLEAYDSGHYDDRLVEQWTAPKAERKGYRQLARWLNVALLRQEMDQVGLSTLGGEVESKYDRLQEGGATAAELRQQLANEGVRIEELTDDFVSYGVVRTHLVDCLGATREEPEPTAWETDAIDISVERARQKLEEAVSSLRTKGSLSGGEDVIVHVDAEVECETCQRRVPLGRAVRRGYICSCTATETGEQ
ncbi:rod-determining factor RdfA [Halomarina rubra]|uniref:Rod-determining factor RdfA n=1 Tax=Halomarina rubra TaxID=2071873 RepID=A0ABD6AWT7_9EURY|nr:rod-determining factor RdfA [Halomarina rubra]